MKKTFSLESICALMIILFLYASISKYVAWGRFIYDMHNQPFPHWMADSLIYVLPPIEIIIAIGLVFSRTRLAALYSSLILMSLFTLYTALVLTHVFHRVPCSCGGIIKYLSWKQHLAFNLFFVGIAYAGIRLMKSSNIDTPASFATA
jgi:putative oxidoreductase